MNITQEGEDMLNEQSSDLEIAIQVLQKELAKDKEEGSYYHGWQSNIAMAFIDEWERYSEEIVGRNKTYDVRHRIANNAAKRFLDQLIQK